MTVSEAFIGWLESQDIATFGQDLYLRKVPDSKETPDEIYWIIPSGGNVMGRNKTGEMVKMYSFIVNFRSMKAQNVEHRLSELEELLNCQSCIDLSGYEVLEVEVSSFPSDSDVDSEGREIGFLSVNIQTYKQRC